MNPELAKAILKVDRYRIPDGHKLSFEARPKVQPELVWLECCIDGVDARLVVRSRQEAVSPHIQSRELLSRRTSTNT